MKFSVLVNNYNYARFLPEMLDSVAAQTLTAHEIIVVDDGSTDESIQVLEDLQKRHPALRVHRQVNGGQLSAIRAGIRLATGDWFAFLDADDTWTPDHLAEAARAISSEADIGFYYCDHRETDGPPIYHSKWPEGAVGPCAALVAATGTRIGTITSALVIRRDHAHAAVDIDSNFDTDWRTRADDCLVFGASLAGAIFFYRKITTVRYRVHGANCFAGTHQDPYAVYRYDLRKWRLIKAYETRIGIRPQALDRMIYNELSFPRNHATRYARRRFFNALKRTSAPLFFRLKVLWFLCRHGG